MNRSNASPATKDYSGQSIATRGRRCGTESRDALWHTLYITLQKQVGCFNHKVVTLVADKLERLWL